jgi:hypothetical protein
MWKQSFGIPFFKVPYGHISFFHRYPHELFSFDRDYTRFKDRLTQDASENKYQLTSERTISVSDRDAYCLEYSRSSPDSASLVRCAVEGSAIAIFYEGDPRYVPELYATLQGISSKNGGKSAGGR